VAIKNVNFAEKSSLLLYAYVNSNFQVIYANKLFLKRFGLSKKAVSNVSIFEINELFKNRTFVKGLKDSLMRNSSSVTIEIPGQSSKQVIPEKWELIPEDNGKKQTAGIHILALGKPSLDILQTRQNSVFKKGSPDEKDLLKTFMTNSTSPTWITDERGTLKFTNKAFENFLNHSGIEYRNTIYKSYPPRLRKGCIETVKKILNTNKNIITVEKFLNAGGDINTLKVFKFPINTPGKRPLIGTIAIDISYPTEIKNQIIINEKKRFQSFNENTPLMAWIVDEKGVLQYMNSRFKKSFNYTDKHLYKKIGSITPAGEREKMLFPHKEVLTKNKCVEFFHQWTDEKNKDHYFRTFIFPIEGETGIRMEGGQSIDITEEVLAQQELKRSYELFEYAGMATRDVIWEWNLKNNMIRRTGGYETLFGYRMNNLYEKQSFRKIHKDDLSIVKKTMEEALSKKASRWQMEYRYLCSDGSFKIVIDQAYIIRDKDGKPVRIIGSMQDVTEERNLQAQVLLTEIEKNKDVVSAVIAAQEKERNELAAELHDNVNQLLAATVLYLKTAQKQEMIEHHLVTQSLDYVERAIYELRNISHNLTPFELKMNGISAALKALTEKLHIPKTFSITLKINVQNENKIVQPLQLALYRIVQEEINNILKHANATKVVITLSEEDDTIHLKVSDNGAGFNISTTRKGLGIANIYNRVENFGGSAQLVTAPGEGCTWNIQIPLG
jgi:PAS domain S-box-containing protein